MLDRSTTKAIPCLPAPRRYILCLALLACLWPVVPGRAIAASTRYYNGAAQPVSPARLLRPILPQLARARFPIYLPAWLPHFRMRVYPIAGVANGGESYFVYLSTRRTGGGDASLVFTLDANLGPPDPMGRRVLLPGGLVAHLDPHTGGNRGPTISWAVGRYSYEIGYLNPNRRLIRAARSMVRVYPRAP